MTRSALVRSRKNPQLSDRPLERADKSRQGGHILLTLVYAMLALAIASVQKYPGAPPWPYALACAALLLVATVFAYRSARKKMLIAADRYGHGLQGQEPAWVIYGRWVRLVLMHISIVCYLVAGLMMSPRSTKLPEHPITWTFIAAGFGAFMLTALPRRPVSRAQVQEERARSAEAVRPVIAELADEIETKLREIAALHVDADEDRKLAQKLSEIASGQFERSLLRASGASRRRAYRQWLSGLLLGIPIGFVVNWTSQPLLDVLGRLFT